MIGLNSKNDTLLKEKQQGERTNVATTMERTVLASEWVLAFASFAESLPEQRGRSRFQPGLSQLLPPPWGWAPLTLSAFYSPQVPQDRVPKQRATAAMAEDKRPRLGFWSQKETPPSGGSWGSGWEGGSLGPRLESLKEANVSGI